MLVEQEVYEGGKVAIYTNRKILRKQIHDVMLRQGFDVGVRASGVDPNLKCPVQVCSIDTERVRSLSNYHPWELHEATLVIVDEIHSNKHPTAQKILDIHEAAGAHTIGLSATPVGLGFTYVREDGSSRRFFDHLENLVLQSELRARGVLVPCDVYSPSEIDMSGVKLDKEGDFQTKHMLDRWNEVRASVVGSIVSSLYQLNPQLKPTVIFAPGVPESRWLAEYLSCENRPQHLKFHELDGLKYPAVPTVHIDAETSEKDREEVFRKMGTGEVKAVTNYGILGEGWDFPAAEHAVLCRPVAAVSVFLQQVGRILRASAGKTRATLQDHVGAWWRPGLGSPNIDRHWKLGDTNKSISKEEKQTREERDPGDKEKEPGRCPKCNRVILARGGEYRCPCGHVFKQITRQVIQLNGELKRMVGSTVKRKKKKDDTDFYRSALYAAYHAGLTTGQAYGLACKKKKEATGDPNAFVDPKACKIRIPARHDLAWDYRVGDVYPHFFKRKES